MPPPHDRADPLAGLSVVVTRPAHQARRLCRMIEEAGGRPLSVPTIGIVPPADPASAARAVARLGEYDVAVFVTRRLPSVSSPLREYSNV